MYLKILSSVSLVKLLNIEGNDGTTYGVYGSASLNRQFAKVPEGSYVWITYKGQEPTKNGRTVKVFVVEYDDEQ